MSILSPAMILMGLVLIAAWATGGPLMRRIKAFEVDMTADEVKTFQDRYAKRDQRADMPARFNEYVALKNRATRHWLASCAIRRYPATDSDSIRPPIPI